MNRATPIDYGSWSATDAELAALVFAQQLLDAIVHRLNGRALPSTQRACLESIRILSREKRDLDTIVSETTLATLTRHAGLATAGGGGGGGGSMILQGADDGEGVMKGSSREGQTKTLWVVSQVRKAVKSVVIPPVRDFKYKSM